MTGALDNLREDGLQIALAVVGVLAVVAVGYGIFLASLRYLVPVVLPLVSPRNPSTAAIAVGVGPTLVYAVVVGALIRRRISADG